MPSPIFLHAIDGVQMENRNRILISFLLVAIGIVLGVSSGLMAQSSSTAQADGTIIEFDEYGTVWTDLTVSDYSSVIELLEAACTENGFDLVMDGDKVLSINGIGSDGAWALWVVYPDSTEWTTVDAPYNGDPSQYSITSWVYSEEDREPTVAVDYSGHPIYGFSQKYRVVSLSPTVTEILYSVKASNIIVGADYYSDYPQSIVEGKKNGSVTTVGTYTSPSFELITSTNPDMVVCDGSQSSHVQMAERLRSVGIDAVVIYPGEDVGQVEDNIFIIGTVLQYQMAAIEVIDDTEYVLEQVRLRTSTEPVIDTMVSLEPDISPWVSGDGTFMNGLLAVAGADNAFSDWYGWVHITSERIPADIQAIVIITTEYKATQEEYDALYNGLSAEWKKTDAWKNGDVFVICESAASMMQRSGPRIAQGAELIGMMLHPDCFDADIPKIIGDDYRDYLQFSKDMGYDD